MMGGCRGDGVDGCGSMGQVVGARLVSADRLQGLWVCKWRREKRDVGMRRYAG